jgi:hypothetical protein
MKESAPWFIWLILEFVGVLFIGSGIPLALRRVPRNALYGARFAATLSDDAIWYAINARCGRHFVAIGVVYLVLLNALVATRILSDIATIVVAASFSTAAVVLDALLLYRAANRLARQG